MIPLLTYPFALLALAALPALALIYLLRHRFRRQPVSSLLLWPVDPALRQGGARLERLQPPLLFLLELLILALLALAAADPRWPARGRARPLIVVLDDSVSMRARSGDATPRTAGREALKREWRRWRFTSARLVVAGRAPRLAGDVARSESEAAAWAAGWACRSAVGDLESAFNLALDMGGPEAAVLVLTDRAPPAPIANGRVRWLAFGAPEPNVGFVQAARTAEAGRERCLLELQNFSTRPVRTRLALENARAPQAALTDLELAPKATHRLVFEAERADAPVRARLADDALAEDNEVLLLPHPPRAVKARFLFHDGALEGLTKKAVTAAGLAVIVDTTPDLLFTDWPDAFAMGPDTWVARVVAGEPAQAYTGPFVVDTAHPLTEGLDLEGVVWGAAPSNRPPGLPVIAAGAVPLVADWEAGGGRHEIALRLNPRYSTVPETPVWPALVWNLLTWRASALPGPMRVNERAGAMFQVALPAEARVEITGPDGRPRQGGRAARVVSIEADQPGLYRVAVGGQTWSIAANLLAPEESDLTMTETGVWGDWALSDSVRSNYTGYGWVFLLAALGLLAIHRALVSRTARVDPA